MEAPELEARVKTVTAEFFTESRVLIVEFLTPEQRVSDHLNGSTPYLDVLRFQSERNSSGDQIDLSGRYGQLNKGRLLLVRPLIEPQRVTGAGNAAWKQTVARDCRAGVGPYRVIGMLHTEAGRDPRVALRAFDKQFLPLTEVIVSYPDGATREYPTIIVNRLHVDFLALKDSLY